MKNGSRPLAGKLLRVSALQALALRPLTSHPFGLRTDLSESAIHEQLPRLLKTTWFSRDLDQLTPADQPRDAMAFACARTAFFVRCAGLLGWVDEALHWEVL